MLSRSARTALASVKGFSRVASVYPAVGTKHVACAAASAVDTPDTRRSLHSTAPAQNSSVVIAGSFAIAFGAIGLRYALVVCGFWHNVRQLA